MNKSFSPHHSLSFSSLPSVVDYPLTVPSIMHSHRFSLLLCFFCLYISDSLSQFISMFSLSFPSLVYSSLLLLPFPLPSPLYSSTMMHVHSSFCSTLLSLFQSVQSLPEYLFYIIETSRSSLSLSFSLLVFPLICSFSLSSYSPLLNFLFLSLFLYILVSNYSLFGK